VLTPESLPQFVSEGGPHSIDIPGARPFSDLCLWQQRSSINEEGPAGSHFLIPMSAAKTKAPRMDRGAFELKILKVLVRLFLLILSRWPLIHLGIDA
jgi:hypothetical protein